ncbi:MAG: hypothetical protein ACKV2Q_25810 [Planctomycetaceae bacterium]
MWLDVVGSFGIDFESLGMSVSEGKPRAAVAEELASGTASAPRYSADSVTTGADAASLANSFKASTLPSHHTSDVVRQHVAE